MICRSFIKFCEKCSPISGTEKSIHHSFASLLPFEMSLPISTPSGIEPSTQSAILSESDSDTEEAVLKRRSEVERQMKKNFRAFMATSKGDEWLLPDTGLVELVVVYRPQRTKKWQAVRGLGSGRLVCNAAASPLVSLCGRRRATECRR